MDIDGHIHVNTYFHILYSQKTVSKILSFCTSYDHQSTNLRGSHGFTFRFNAVEDVHEVYRPSSIPKIGNPVFKSLFTIPKKWNIQFNFWLLTVTHMSLWSPHSYHLYGNHCKSQVLTHPPTSAGERHLKYVGHSRTIAGLIRPFAKQKRKWVGWKGEVSKVDMRVSKIWGYPKNIAK
jgi:hypothetical protein